MGVTVRTYTPEEDKFIKKNWRKMSDAEIGEAINRSANSVRLRRCEHLKIYRRVYSGEIILDVLTSGLSDAELKRKHNLTERTLRSHKNKALMQYIKDTQLKKGKAMHVDVTRQYWENEEELIESFNPVYKVEDLKGDELEILNKLNIK